MQYLADVTHVHKISKLLAIFKIRMMRFEKFYLPRFFKLVLGFPQHTFLAALVLFAGTVNIKEFESCPTTGSTVFFYLCEHPQIEILFALSVKVERFEGRDFLGVIVEALRTVSISRSRAGVKKRDIVLARKNPKAFAKTLHFARLIFLF